MRARRGALAYAALDFVVCLFLAALVQINEPTRAQAIATEGVYAIEASWRDGLDVDVDLYLRDPAANLAFYRSVSVGLMHLEHDDLGAQGDSLNGVNVATNHERTVLRGVLQGEYVVNVHAFRKQPGPPVDVTVTLSELRGVDRRLRTARVTLSSQGDELTAFRFRVDGAGRVRGYSTLQRRFVGSL